MKGKGKGKGKAKAIAHGPRRLRTRLDHRQNSGGGAYLQLTEPKRNHFIEHYDLRPGTPAASEHSGGNICLLNGGGDSDDDRKRLAEEVVRQDSTLELVEAGPLAVGYSPFGRIVHMNFDAKIKGKPVVQPVVLTFFAELTITNKNAVVVNNYGRVGPRDSLPAIADTSGCLYCCSYDNIHHADYYLHPFRCGREQHLATLTHQAKQLRDFIAEGEKDVCFSPRFSHPGVKYRRQYEGHDVTDYANVALSLFNELEGKNFVLVKIVHSSHSRFPGLGVVNHINFEAVNEDDPHAQVQTFFAEVISNVKFIFADFCKCLGPSALLPSKADLHGCRICKVTHHPPGQGYLTGREYFGKS